jgi:hydroxypyruvate reductase
MSARRFLEDLFAAAVAAAHPSTCLAPHLPAPPQGGRLIVLAAGKAAGSMTEVAERHYLDERNVRPDRLGGLAVTRHGYARPTRLLPVIEAGHPVPDQASLDGAARTLALADAAQADDLVLVLMSGGASANWIAPVAGLALAEKQAVTRALLKSGAAIGEMNTVRKHLSRIKGGRLAAAARPARLVSLLISDVPGDDPAVIASGPTVPDPSTLADVAEIVARFRLELPAAAKDVLAAGEETPKPGEIAGEVHVIAAPSQALAAAADVARASGVTPLILGDAIEGESREVATVMAGIARSVRAHALPVAPPAVLLSGGETTVTIGAGRAGRGGRNTEFLLALAIAAQGQPGTWAIAGDSDGIDGTEDAAGALVAPDSVARGRAIGLDARQFLAAHDSYSWFDKLGDLIRTGPTLTNVNDIRAVLIA